MARIAGVDVGPLAAYADGFRAELAGLGYTPECTVHKLWEAGRLGDWMTANGVEVGELSPARVREFFAAHDAVGERAIGRRTLGPLLGYLRGVGVVPAETVGATPVELLVGRYRVWLVEERGLAARTVGRYEMTARRFLTSRASAGGCGAEGLCGADVTGFLLAECSRVSVGSAKGRVAELRSLLRFLFVEGLTATALAAAVPPVAGWRDTALPPTLTRAQVTAMLDSCDRATVTGCRDFAILMVLARLGLRAAEAAGLTLDDLDWRAGEIVVRGKGRRDDRLPLPVDVGEAIVSYVRGSRPTTACRAVFLTRYAPMRALAPVTVSKVAVAASRRAGLAEAVPAHRLRHALAADMLRHGAVLADISQVLRHRDLATTAIYAKVDHAALRELALDWPVTP